jgi:tetratricopeptide (TPR) repeat protein
VILAQLALAKLVDGAPARAAHLVRAAELTSEDQSPEVQARALDLYEEALHLHAECELAARALARMLASDPSRLTDRLGGALEKASAPSAVALLGAEIGRAVLRHHARAGAPEPGVGIAAMRRVVGVTPNDAEALLLMARLLTVQRVWADARDTLVRALVAALDAETKITVHFLLAELHEGPLADLPRAQESLQAVLALDPKNRLALERLHKVSLARGDHALVLHTLGRLVEIAPDPVARAEAGIRLADACREAGDAAGVVRALCDAIVSAPGDSRAWTALGRLYRIETGEGAAAYAKALQQLLDLAASRRLPSEPRWLTTLGLLEVTTLLRAREGLAHLQQATLLPAAPPEARAALGRGLEAAGRNSEAVQILRETLSADPEVFARLPDLAHALAAIDAALAKDGRPEERLAVEEVRACLGDVPLERVARLRTRRLAAEVPYPTVLAGPEVGRLIVPEARSSMIDVAVALAPVVAKSIRFELGNLGIGSRERVSSRDGHPTRSLAERIGRALGIEAFELYLAPTWQGAARVYPGDPPAIVAASSFIELPELEQAFALARLLSRVALGFTFLDEISIEAADGLLLAAVRAVEPGFASGELAQGREHAVQGMLPGVQRAIGRRQRKIIEEIAHTLTAAYDPRAFTIGVRRSEYRIAYVLSGDALAAIDYLRRFDREIARSSEEPRILLQHPVTNELLRYALTADAYAERRRAGTVWANV